MDQTRAQVRNILSCLACRQVSKEVMREIVFDTETTGLSPAGGDRMVEIGCIEMIGRIETGATSTAISTRSA